MRAQLQVAQDQKYITDSRYEHLYNLARQISGMISKFIGHLQTTDYQGEKVERPKREAAENEKKVFEKFFDKFGFMQDETGRVIKKCEKCEE